MSQWIRLHDRVLDDPQLQTLPADRFRFLINCWLWAGRTNNDLGTYQMIAWRLRADESVTLAHVEALLSIGLLIDVDGSLTVKDWDEWQYDSDDRAEYMRKWRAGKKSEKRESRVNHANITRDHGVTNRDSRVTVTRDHDVNHVTITRESQRREEKSREEESRVERVPAPALPLPLDCDPQAELRTLAAELVQQLPAGGDAHMTAKALEYDFGQSVTFDGNAAGYIASVRRRASVWRTAWDENADLRRKRAEYWVKDGDYTRDPPAKARAAPAGRQSTLQLSRPPGCRKCGDRGWINTAEDLQAAENVPFDQLQDFLEARRSKCECGA